MIMPYDIKPQASLYVYGAYVLRALKDQKYLRITDLFMEVKSKHEFSFSVFVLTLDWLFMIGALEMKCEDGEKYVYQKAWNWK